MSDRSIAERLSWCLDRGNLTVADLARWFDRPDPTVRGWIRNGGGVGGPPHDVQAIYRNLERLEKAITSGKGFPVPQLSPSERIAYIAAMQR